MLDAKVVAVALFLPGLALLGAALAWRRLRTAAKHTRLAVKYVHRAAIDQSHVLDIDPAFVQRFEKGERCQVMSLATYLGSLDYGNDAATAKAVIVTLLTALGGKKGTALLPLVPLMPLPNRDIGPSATLLSRFALAEFPSALLAAAMVDGGTSFFQAMMAQNGADDASPDAPPADAMTKLARGGELMCDTPACISTQAPLVHSVATMDLGPNPDVKMTMRPEPFAPELLPNLCLGMGGLVHQETPRTLACNQMLAAILNRLAANAYAWAGYTDSQGRPFAEWHFAVGETVVSTPAELLAALCAHGGGQFHSRIRTNNTAFGLGLCLKVDNKGGVRDYIQIPIAFCMRTGATTNEGEAIHMLSQHSQIEWNFTDNSLLFPGETLSVGFYTGVGGFTGFYAGGEWDRPWVIESACEVPLTNEEALRAMVLGHAVALTANLTVREWKFPFGGYGGIGVCADSVAIVEKALRDETRIFPLLMRGDAKAAFIATASRELMRNLEGHTELTTALTDMVVALIRLPNDIQIEPHEIISTLDRIEKSVLPTPFWSDRKERARLPRVRKQWSIIFEPFKQDLLDVGGALNQTQE